MIIYMKRAGKSLAPVDGNELDKLTKVRADNVYKVDVKIARDYTRHKRFFAFLKIIFENQDKYSSFNSFRHELTMRTGRFTAHHHISGAISYSPKSIAFDKMSEEEFTDLCSDSIDVALEHFCSNLDNEILWNIARFG